MNKYDRIYFDILNGNSDSNINFNDLCHLLEKLGAHHRIKGDHHIFYFDGIMDIINIQPKGNKAKAYQVKQIRFFFARYGIMTEDE